MTTIAGQAVRLLACAAGMLMLLGGCATMGPDKPPIRPVDHACLAAGPTNRHVPAYAAEVPFDAIEVAIVDSFACDARDAQAVESMLADLRAKGAATGADALMRVRMLNDRQRGYVNNPRTPFPSIMPGETKWYFLRASAVKFTKPVRGLPREVRAADFVKAEGGGDARESDRRGALPLAGAAGVAPGLPRF
ncbi:MAG: hypothetical protein N2111_08260 [Candidatus Sumerlaeaceae bacterium]|nr:hypothetical protein [Candidatus Sumerlaeaceae bacterium]